MSGQHARLSASSAHRWLVCAGSVNASKGLDSTSYEAAQGTVAHEIAACILRDGHSKIKPAETVIQEGHQIDVDQEMMDSVHFYVQTVLDDEQPGDEFWTEMSLIAALQKIDIDLGGTADRIRYRPNTKHLRVFDFKHGSGVYVDVHENEQELIYALGAMLEIKRPVKDVTLTIVQPRFEGAEPVRDYHFSAIQILDFIARVQEAAVITRRPDAPLVAGDHCKFCPARSVCPELEKHEHALVADDFAIVSAITPEKLAQALGSIALVKARIKAIEEHAYAEAQRGVEIPGWKLVDKRPVRRWTTENEIVLWMTTAGVDPYKPREIISPAQLETLLKATAPRGKKKEAILPIASLIESKSSGTVLVPVADDRPTAQHAITAGDFAVLPSTDPQLLGF